MKHLIVTVLVALSAVQLGGCASTRGSLKNPEVKKVAVVSFALNDWGDTSVVRTGGDSASGGFGSSMKTQRAAIQKATDQIFAYTEERLAENWQVKKASTFVGDKTYRTQTVDKTLDAYVPIIKNKELGVFTENSMALKKARLTSDQAVALCSALDVDAVFVIFSEWTTKTGSTVPITRPYTKNVFTVWDKSGIELYARRIDRMGAIVIGGAGAKVSIGIPRVLDDFMDSYKQAIVLALR